jgi:hypothetical protein
VRRALAALAVAAMSIAGLVAATPASAGTVTSNGLTITAADQYMKPGCAYYPIHYSVTGDYPDGWWLDVTFTKLGSVGDFDFKTDTDGPAGDLHAFLCDGLDDPGVWEVDATLTNFTGPDATVHTTFQWKKAPSAVTINARPAKTRTGGYVTFSGKASYRNGSTWRPIPRASVTIQYKLRGTTTWRTFANVHASASGLYSSRLKYRFKVSSRFRVRLNAGEVFAGSYSRSVYVTRVR